MHRNAYKGRKFGREKDQRRALLKGLADSLIIHESVETTYIKAKELVSYTEKLITKAKKADLASRRSVISSLQTRESASKLIDDLAPKLASRTSGYLRVVGTTKRKGDNSQLAKVSFVFDSVSQSSLDSEATAKSDSAEANKPTEIKAKAVK